jgi:hypothetical protein
MADDIQAADAVAGVVAADFELTWDPPWSP